MNAAGIAHRRNWTPKALAELPLALSLAWDAPAVSLMTTRDLPVEDSPEDGGMASVADIDALTVWMARQSALPKTVPAEI
ncbi:MAG: hypothetical protein K2Y29_12040 [Beijerinckiaceae bacterium]|nr:hypothetical protein [Beijerinckiaceae bacterium]